MQKKMNYMIMCETNMQLMVYKKMNICHKNKGLNLYIS